MPSTIPAFSVNHAKSAIRQETHLRRMAHVNRISGLGFHDDRENHGTPARLLVQETSQCIADGSL